MCKAPGSFKVLAFKKLGKDRNCVIFARKPGLMWETDSKADPAPSGTGPLQLPHPEVCPTPHLTGCGGQQGEPVSGLGSGVWMCQRSPANWPLLSEQAGLVGK